nr:nucleic acid-binding, OB-fold protein [Tanacetum cinerariifolium]
MKVEDSLNVTFDETLLLPKTSPLEDDVLVEEEAIEVSKTKPIGNDLENISLENYQIVIIKESKTHPLENVIVPNPMDMAIIGTKWVYRNKLDENGVVTRNKARLVAQGYNQQEGIDYDETYAPVARLESIRILLAYAYALDFKLYQMDVKSASLNGFIIEEVYVAQPPGFIDFAKPNYVYRLKKALYCLKQAPQAWYKRLKAFLIKHDYSIGMNTKMQASVRSGLVNQFKYRLEEGKAVTLQRYSLGEIQPKYRMVNKALRLSFLSSTEVEVCNDFTGSLYGFDFRSYRGITDLQQEQDGQFAFAQQFSDFLGTCSDHGKIIVVLQLAMMKIWDGKMCVQNGYNGKKLFTFDCTVPIVDDSFIDVKEYSDRLFANQDVAQSENTASGISTASKNSTKESFVSKIPPKNIAELLDVAQGVTSVIVGTIIAIHEEESWWYIGCKFCKKKVIRSSDMIDLEAEMPKKKIDVK